MSGRLGSHGAMNGAASASSARPATTIPPITARRIRRNAFQNPPMASAPTPTHTDPWIHEAVSDVGGQVRQEREGGHDHEVAHEHGIVTLEGGLHHELAHARDGEDPLDDHAAADEAG